MVRKKLCVVHIFEQVQLDRAGVGNEIFHHTIFMEREKNLLKLQSIEVGVQCDGGATPVKRITTIGTAVEGSKYANDGAIASKHSYQMLGVVHPFGIL